MQTRLISLLFASLVLAGCSSIQNSNTFRNRTFDYDRETVINLPAPLQTPSNLTAPTFTPVHQIPSGPNTYPAGDVPLLTPPGFSDQVVIPPASSKAKASNS